MQNTTLAVAGSSKGGSYPLTGSKDEAGVYINHMGTMSRRLTHVERQLAEDVRDDAVVQDAILPMAEYSEGMIGTHIKHRILSRDPKMGRSIHLLASPSNRV